MEVITTGINTTANYAVSNSIFIRCQQSSGGAICVIADANVNLSYLIISECSASGITLQYATASLFSLCFTNCKGGHGGDYTIYELKNSDVQYLQSFKSSFSTHSTYIGCHEQMNAQYINASDSENYNNLLDQGYGSGLTTWFSQETKISYITLVNCKKGYGIIGFDHTSAKTTFSRMNIILCEGLYMVTFKTNEWNPIFEECYILDNIANTFIDETDCHITMDRCHCSFPEEFVGNNPHSGCSFSETLEIYEHLLPKKNNCYLEICSSTTITKCHRNDEYYSPSHVIASFLLSSIALVFSIQ